MAKLKAFKSIDMTDTSPEIGWYSYADNDLVQVSTYNVDVYYYGDFTFPNDYWRGTVKKIYEFKYDKLQYYVTGLHQDAEDFQVGSSPDKVLRDVFSDEDRIRGSNENDTLKGFDANDDIHGKKGDDKIQGNDGHDVLKGGAGDDRISGGKGRDVIMGSSGDDKLTGGKGRDVFVFSKSDDRDKIKDFQDNIDSIHITRGAKKYDDLDIYKEKDNVYVEFKNTQIIIEDISLRKIDADDFVFI